jgi:hypothetical protein
VHIEQSRHASSRRRWSDQGAAATDSRSGLDCPSGGCRRRGEGLRWHAGGSGRCG